MCPARRAAQKDPDRPGAPQTVVERRRARERAQRLDKIRAAATRVFGRRGYEGATMALIAAEAELGKASLYYYFPTKSALFGDLVAATAKELERAVTEAMTEAGEPLEVIALYLRETVHLFAAHPEFAAVHRRASTAGPDLFRDLAGQEAAEAVGRSHALLGRAIGQLAGRLPRRHAATLPRLIASFLLGLGARVEGAPAGAPETSTNPAALDEEIALFVDGLRALAHAARQEDTEGAPRRTQTR